MSKTASEILTEAKSWLGKNETDGSFRYIIDLYNSHKPLARNYKVQYDDEWCATTISALSIHCGYTDIIPTECGCQKMIELFEKLGCWVENENRVPNPGDIIFYDWNDSKTEYKKTDCKGWADHVGIVEKVANNTITTIEGNLNRAVSRNKIAVNSRCIRGYAVPKYDKELPFKSLQDVAQEVIDGEWGVGEDRKKRLAAAGYSYAEVQSLVNDMLAPKYYPKYTGKSIYVDKVLEAIGVPAKYRGSWARRKPIAMASGMKDDYRGTASQNNQLISLAKKGKIKQIVL